MADTDDLFMHLMVDIETLSTSSDAAILSIGAVFFNPDVGILGDQFYAQISAEEATRHGQVDGATLRWWMNQSPAAIEAAFNGQMSHQGALVAFSSFAANRYMRGPGPETYLRVWANGPSFDLTILEYAFRRAHLPVPWSYRAPRDVRTILNLPGIVLPETPETLVAHHALDDALLQAGRVICAWQQIASRAGDTEDRIHG